MLHLAVRVLGASPRCRLSWTKLRWAEDIPRNRWVISFVQQVGLGGRTGDGVA